MKPVTHARSSGRLPIRVRGRSHTALVLAPEPPIAAWLADLDALLQRSPAAFSGHLALLNVSGLSLSGPDLTALVNELRDRDIRLMGVEGEPCRVSRRRFGLGQAAKASASSWA